MGRLRIAHECPIDIFDKVDALTDYSYCLVHLLDENPRYRSKFEDVCKEGRREVILDNSIFELGTSFDGSKYSEWVWKLQPTHYIVPDVLEDTDATLKKRDEWFKHFLFTRNTSKSIGVIQGKTYEDLVRCYNEMEPSVDKVAISFDYSYYLKQDKGKNKWQTYMFGRRVLLEKLLDDGIINMNKPHHLLGCALPQEFDHYKGLEFSFLDTVDTSNPVVHGLNGIRYTPFGLREKVSTKLIEYMDEEVPLKQWEDIKYNIWLFRNFCQ